MSRFATFKRISGVVFHPSVLCKCVWMAGVNLYFTGSLPVENCHPSHSMDISLKIDILLACWSCAAQNNSGMQIRRVQFDIFIGRDWIYIDTPASCVRSVFVGWWGRTERAHNGRMMMRFKVLLPRPQERCPTAASELHLIRIAAAGEIFAPKSAGYDFGDSIHQYGNYFISREQVQRVGWYINLCACA